MVIQTTQEMQTESVCLCVCVCVKKKIKEKYNTCIHIYTYMYAYRKYNSFFFSLTCSLENGEREKKKTQRIKREGNAEKCEKNAPF